MTGYQVLAVVCVLYLLSELGAIPLGHAIGKRVSVARIILIVIAALYAVNWYVFDDLIGLSR